MSSVPKNEQIPTEDFSEESTAPSQITFSKPDKIAQFAVHELDRDRNFIGKTILFGYYKHNPIFTIGPHCIFCDVNEISIKGPFYLGFNSFLVPFYILFLYYLVSSVSKIMTLIGALISFFQAISYFGTFIINPGIPNMKLSMSEELSINFYKNKEQQKYFLHYYKF